jgi:NAD(P)-dependent dehydrogenase (short-subunit alcohol dehydrogenase family)
MPGDSSLIAVVTGASRGAGRGIAIALGEAGATVYVTGRTTKSGEAPLPGTIFETAEAVNKAGGRGIAVYCDHADDSQTKALFERVETEQGRLDILVNNVAFIHDDLTGPAPFWERPLTFAKMLDVGLRSQYVASFYAAPLLIRQRRGLVVFTSSFGSVCYMHGPAYGVQKVSADKFAADMAVDFRSHGVAAVSIWMGPLKTERSAAAAELSEEYAAFMANAETPQFTGRIIASLYRDPDYMALSGQTLVAAELGVRYGIKDEGREPPSYRAMLGEPRQPSSAMVA